MDDQIKQLIGNAKNICVIGNQNEPATSAVALALFYTLNELGKNVNPILDSLPKEISFLTPSADFLSAPKNFVLSIPRSVADISQIYYEKSDSHLKIHLTINHGRIKKDQLDFYAQEPKPDIVITLGIQNFKSELEGRLNAFGFLLSAPVINIDSAPTNEKYGTVNLLDSSSIAEITLGLLRAIDEAKITKQTAECLLASLIITYQNFQSESAGEQTFAAASFLMKKGADRASIAKAIAAPSQSQPPHLIAQPAPVQIN